MIIVLGVKNNIKIVDGTNVDHVKEVKEDFSYKIKKNVVIIWWFSLPVHSVLPKYLKLRFFLKEIS